MTLQTLYICNAIFFSTWIIVCILSIKEIDESISKGYRTIISILLTSFLRIVGLGNLFLIILGIIVKIFLIEYF